MFSDRSTTILHDTGDTVLQNLTRVVGNLSVGPRVENLCPEVRTVKGISRKGAWISRLCKRLSASQDGLCYMEFALNRGSFIS